MFKVVAVYTTGDVRVLLTDNAARAQNQYLAWKDTTTADGWQTTYVGLVEASPEEIAALRG